MYSDDYFKINDDKYDIIFIDGLHEYRQVLKDIINALNNLTHTGVVLLDDVIPSNNIEASKKFSLLTESEKKM
jgi:predicted O-methyltransferase YrrM